VFPRTLVRLADLFFDLLGNDSSFSLWLGELSKLQVYFGH
jgi:hypothetical protein